MKVLPLPGSTNRYTCFLARYLLAAKQPFCSKAKHIDSACMLGGCDCTCAMMVMLACSGAFTKHPVSPPQTGTALLLRDLFCCMKAHVRSLAHVMSLVGQVLHLWVTQSAVKVSQALFPTQAQVRDHTPTSTCFSLLSMLFPTPPGLKQQAASPIKHHLCFGLLDSALLQQNCQAIYNRLLWIGDILLHTATNTAQQLYCATLPDWQCCCANLHCGHWLAKQRGSCIHVYVLRTCTLPHASTLSQHTHTLRMRHVCRTPSCWHASLKRTRQQSKSHAIYMPHEQRWVVICMPMCHHRHATGICCCKQHEFAVQ